MTVNDSPESRQQQIALMTRTMFDAVAANDAPLFQLAIKKGADPFALSPAGEPLLHVAMYRAVRQQNSSWIAQVLPYTDDFFVADSQGHTVFSDAYERKIRAHEDATLRHHLTQFRRFLMEKMPDIDNTKKSGPAPATAAVEGREVLAPSFRFAAGDRDGTGAAPDGARAPHQPPRPPQV